MTINQLQSIRHTQFLHTHLTSILKKYKYNLNLGDIVAGSVFSIEARGCLVDIGDNQAAFLPKEESLFTNYDCSSLKIIQEFFILSYNSNLSQLVLSSKRLRDLRVWERMKQVQSEDANIYGKIVRKNSGGLLVNFDGISGFVPNSHIINVAFKNYMVNTIIPLKFLVLNDQGHDILLSHKRAVLSFSQLTIGDIINAKVIKMKNYGIFVKVQNMQALLHISEVPKTILHQLYSNFHANTFIKVMIIHIDNKQGRLSVSIRKITIS